MRDIESLIRETEERYQQRQETRDDAEKKIRTGHILDANTRRDVAERLSSLHVSAHAVDVAEMLGQPTEVAGLGVDDYSVLERLIGRNDLMPIHYLELAQQASRAVGLIHVGNSFGQTISFGTGWMVSPRLLMTNNHVVESVAAASQSQVQFNYQYNALGQAAPTTFFRLDPDAFFLTDRTLDYTLVAVGPRVAGTSELSDFGWIPLQEDVRNVLKGEYVTIIQHPNREAKQIALRENQVVDLPDPWLHYHTDTAPGSSGSPVFNDQWQAVGLHHSGVPMRDPQGKILAVTGVRWQPHMGEHRIHWLANEGAQISRIVRHLQSSSLGDSQKRLRADIFERERIAAPGIQPVPKGRAPQSSATEDVDSLPPTIPPSTSFAAGGASWIIPLHVNVQLGGVVPSLPIAVPATPAPTVSRPTDDSRHRMRDGATADSELQAALAELNAFETRMYYDEDAD
ncbi:MAG: trypsin-like peptidase domain-containing protein, partial [Planctomycetaceae bacterium]|nr:trypsin-like peptidase domain-containing protein [Planctomycetaceae bacterium]